MKKLSLIALVLLLAVGAAAAVVWSRVNAPFRGYSGEEQYVDIPVGSSPAAIGARLVAAGVVRDRLTYRVAVWLSGNARRLQAGEYRFDRPLTARDVVDKIARGEVAQIVITFPEGLTLEEMGVIVEQQGLGSASAFVQAARDVSAIRAIDPAAQDLEGYLFPDTYAVPRRTDVTRLVEIMVSRFTRVLTPEIMKSAADRGLDVRGLVTLASIVEKETARADERPLVAAVYFNRLKAGMGLQCDPTVIYALQRAGRFDGNLRRADLAFDSPYNTYRYRGLPPGPIAAAGKASLEAAAAPADVDFLYFVSRNDGSHEFARTLAEHNRNVRKFQVQYFLDRRARGR